MFDSLGGESKHPVTSPTDFGGPSRMFDSPKHTDLVQAGFNSPGFEGSQQSGGNIDHVFADLVHDHDTITGLDGANETREKDIGTDEASAVPSTETPAAGPANVGGGVEMTDAMTDQSTSQMLTTQESAQKALDMEEFVDAQES